MNRRSWTIGIGGLLVLAAAAAITAGAAGRSTGASASAGPPVPVETGTVTRQDLVIHDVEDGTWGYVGHYQIVGTRAGVLTWVPSAGQTIGLGQTVYRVDDHPVTLWRGKTPFWRPLSRGMDDGPDVRELEENLKRLHYFSRTPDETFTTATATAVKKWQKALGRERTGRVDPGAVVVLPTDLRVTEVTGVLGGPAQGTLLEASGTGRVVTVRMPVTKQAEATTGASVTITLPDGSHTAGRITSVGTVATTPSDAGSGSGSRTPTIDVLITPADPKAAGGLDKAPVSVSFTSQRTRDVLTVPVTALLALSEGGYAIESVDGRLLEVDLGAFADGRVEVSGDGVREGLKIKVADA